jgi:hypothetical protein
MTTSSQRAAISTGFDSESQSWILASQEVRPCLPGTITWSNNYEPIGAALRRLASSDIHKVKIVAHGDSESLVLSSKLSVDDFKDHLLEHDLDDRLTKLQISLWSCFGGCQGGIGEVLSELTGASVSSSTKEVGRGAGISELTSPDDLDEKIRHLPITLHTNAVGFDVIDNLNGTFGLVVYYGTWHSSKSENQVTEGALSLYTLAAGKDGSDPNNYTVEAYGQGGSVQNQTFLPSNPPKITSDIFIPDKNVGATATTFIQGKDGKGKQDLTDAGFKPGENLFFSKQGDTTLYGYNSLDGVNLATGFSGTYGFQSIYIPTVAPGTYKSYYDGKGNWDNSQPTGANKITMIFEPSTGIASSLFTLTGSGKLIFGEAPKILIGSIDFDNGVSKTDFVTTGKDIVINGTYSNVTGNAKDTIQVTVKNKATLVAQTFQASDPELAVDGAGKWVLTMPSELPAAKYDIEATILESAKTYTANQELNIVSASIESITDDNGVSAIDKKTSDQTLVFNGIYSSKTATDIKLSLKDSSDNIIFQDQAPTTKIVDDWSFDFTGTTLALGTYTLSATVSDASGDATASADIVIQDLPDAPVIASITEDTGTPGDFSTTDTQVVVSGTFDKTAVPNKSSSHFINISLAGNTYTDGGTNPLTVNYAAGTWSFTSKTLDIGQYQIEAYIVDTNGLFNSSSKALTIVNAADTTPPQAPTITTIDTDTGMKGDFTTVDSSIKIIGTYDSTDALGGLAVEFGGTTYQLGTDTQLVTLGDNWELTVPGIAVTGEAKVTATDGGGNSSSATQQITIVPAPKVTFTSIISDTGIAGDFITNDESITINGTFEEATASSGSFEVKFGGKTYTLASAELSNTGDNWTLAVPGKATSGLAEATLTDAAGNEGKANQSIVIDVTAPTQPTITAIDEDTGTAGDFTTIDKSIDITGTYDSSDGLSEFSVSFGGKKYVLGVNSELTSNSDDWKLEVPGVAATGTVTATAIDKAGNISANSQKITILNKGVTISPSGGGSGNKGVNQLIFQSGQTSSTTFTVVLNAPPTGDVTVTLSGYDKDKYSLSTDTLTFTKDNWDKPQTVTIKSIDNTVVSSDVVGNIIATASNTGGYEGIEKSTLKLVSKAGSNNLVAINSADNLDLLVTSKQKILKSVATLSDSSEAIAPAAKASFEAKGIAFGDKAISYDQKVDKKHSDANFNLKLSSIASNLKLTKSDSKKLVYYQLSPSGELTPYNYDPKTQTGAKFFDLNGDGVVDFASLSQIDGIFGDGDKKLNENINSLSTVASVTLNPTLNFENKNLITYADLVDNLTPGAFNVKATLLSRGKNVQSIGYVLIDSDELANSDAILSDLSEIKSRSVHLFSSLESIDLTLASSFSFHRDFQLLNGQSIRFFNIDDGLLSDITDLGDSRFSWLTPSVNSDGSLNLSGGDNVILNINTESSPLGLSDLIAQDQHISSVLDFSPFTSGETISGVVEIAREADFDSVIGFYRTVNNEGGVLAADGITVLLPGDSGYSEAALLASNKVKELDNLTVADNQTKEISFTLSEFTHIVPYAVVNGQSLFAFAAANASGVSHFRTIGDNLFGYEDTFKGDDDHDDMVIGFTFNNLA